MRIGIANESPQEIAAFRQLLERSGHQIAWVAVGGQEAVMRCARDRPDLVLLELHLSTMNGIATTRRIMRESPCPILITTAALDSSFAQVFEALGAGALDVAHAPVPGCSENKNSPAAFLAKLERLARLLRPAAAEPGLANYAAKQTLRQATPLVVIGCSAGGPAAVATVLGGLPPEFPAGIIVVQHLDEQFASGLATWLNQRSRLPVRVAREGDRPTPGLVQLANATGSPRSSE
jgi:chemotaxis response regulator CheB